jgi:hypothetical protein
MLMAGVHRITNQGEKSPFNLKERGLMIGACPRCCENPCECREIALRLVQSVLEDYLLSLFETGKSTNFEQWLNDKMEWLKNKIYTEEKKGIV